MPSLSHWGTDQIPAIVGTQLATSSVAKTSVWLPGSTLIDPQYFGYDNAGGAHGLEGELGMFHITNLAAPNGDILFQRLIARFYDSDANVEAYVGKLPYGFLPNHADVSQWGTTTIDGVNYMCGYIHAGRACMLP